MESGWLREEDAALIEEDAERNAEQAERNSAMRSSLGDLASSGGGREPGKRAISYGSHTGGAVELASRDLASHLGFRDKRAKGCYLFRHAFLVNGLPQDFPQSSANESGVL